MNKHNKDKRREWGPRVNHKIRIPQIRVLTDDGKMLGIMSPQEAMKIAKEHGLDLVEIVPNARPPVCKIIEYGKYKYEQSKKSSPPKKTKFKEMKFRPVIDENDYNVKLKKVYGFLKEGNQASGKRIRGIAGGITNLLNYQKPVVHLAHHSLVSKLQQCLCNLFH